MKTESSTDPLRIAIVDDEAPARRIIRKLIEAYCPDAFVVAEAATVAQATEVIHATRPDLLLLDIEMRNETGFDLLDKIKVEGLQTVFITAHENYALDAFRAAATDYLVKPINIELLQESLTRVRAYKKNQTASIASPNYSITQTNGKRLVRKDDIVSIEADGSYATYVLSSGERLYIAKKLGQIEEELKDSDFVRIHRSTLINLKYAVVAKSNQITLNGGHTYSVSRSRAVHLREVLRMRGIQ